MERSLRIESTCRIKAVIKSIEANASCQGLLISLRQRWQAAICFADFLVKFRRLIGMKQSWCASGISLWITMLLCTRKTSPTAINSRRRCVDRSPPPVFISPFSLVVLGLLCQHPLLVLFIISSSISIPIYSLAALFVFFYPIVLPA